MPFAAASRCEKGNDLRAKNQGRRRKATRAIARAKVNGSKAVCPVRLAPAASFTWRLMA